MGSKFSLQHVGLQRLAIFYRPPRMRSAHKRAPATMFKSQVNPVTGKLEWVPQDRDVTSEDSDISPELARSQYGDMLHDTLRNKLYCRALERAVAKVRSKGMEPHVLDIGTGTGLLAMMAARAGSTRVTAVEVMRPMVRIAREVIATNGYSDIITVVPKRSTEMIAADMPAGKANILVTEVFDTELIGEGALVTYSHALRNLLEPGSIVIPDSATVFVQLISSQFLSGHHKLDPQNFPVPLSLPPSWTSCSGHPSLWDLHAEQLLVPQQMTLLSAPTPVARFPLSDPSLSPDQTNPATLIGVTESGSCHGVLIWWSADMSGEEMSMDPWNYIQWRDHWLQAVQLLPQPISLSKGDHLNITCRHDDYCMWFDVQEKSPPSSSPPSPPPRVNRPLCTCGVHTAWSRCRLSTLNDRERSQLYLTAMTEALVGQTSVLCVSDGSLLPLLLASATTPLSLQTIYILESNPYSARALEELLLHNPPPPDKTIKLINKSPSQVSPSDLTVATATTPSNQTPCLVGAVVGEPYFSTSLLPWHNLHFWYALNTLREREVVTEECVVVPRNATLMAIAVHFTDLYSLRAPVGNVEGFDLSAFDKRVGKVSNDCAHEYANEWVEPEPHPLWEYPSYPCSSPYQLMTFDLSSPIPSKTMTSLGKMSLFGDSGVDGGEGGGGGDGGGGREGGGGGGGEGGGGGGDDGSEGGGDGDGGGGGGGGGKGQGSENAKKSCNAVVLWMEYRLWGDHITTTGLVKTPYSSSELLQWNTGFKQAVHFMPPICVYNAGLSELYYSVEFNTTSGELHFTFNPIVTKK